MPSVDVSRLDATVHGPVRLGVLTALKTDGTLDFSSLKRRLVVTDGALGMHLQRLEDSGYVQCEKAFVGRRPRSTYRMTAAGRRALAGYLDAMLAIIVSVKKSRRR
jgi:predicted ArsR family transcriptional regulator